MTLKTILFYAVIGLIAGFLAGIIRKGRGFGLVGNLIVGIGGAVVGGYLFRLIRISIYNPTVTIIIAATVGALILLWLIGLIKR